MTRLLILLPLAIGLSACQSTKIEMMPAPYQPPELTAQHRASLALRLAPIYIKDGTGPAEITRGTTSRATATRGSTYFSVRYPVVARTPGERILAPLSTKSGSGMRCISITMDRDAQSQDSVRFSSSRLREDPLTCGERQEWEPYAELNSAKAQVAACRARGDARCPVRLRPGREAETDSWSD